MAKNKRFGYGADVEWRGDIIIDYETEKSYDFYEVGKLLNELAEENQDLRILLNQCSDQRNEFHRGARENANRVGQLEKENNELKQQIKEYSNIKGDLIRLNNRLVRRLVEFNIGYEDIVGD